MILVAHYLMKLVAHQIDELAEKGFVKESMGPCSVLTLLVLKKDDTFCLCMHSKAINNITIKYIYPIPRLDYMLD